MAEADRESTFLRNVGGLLADGVTSHKTGLFIVASCKNLQSSTVLENILQTRTFTFSTFGKFEFFFEGGRPRGKYSMQFMFILKHCQFQDCRTSNDEKIDDP
jgi:hypothetical protein